MQFYNASQRRRLLLLVLLMVSLLALMYVVANRNEVQAPSVSGSKTTTKKAPAVEPQLASSELLAGLSHPWDIAFLPDGIPIFNERSGEISKIVDGKKQRITEIGDVYRVGEGGLTGLALDAEFEANRFIYTCFNARTASGIDVRLVRWRLSEEADALTDRADIVTGIPSNASGRHSGCRVRVAKDATLWVGTGDAAVASHPQNPNNLGGKILHVTRDGMPASNNLPAPFDPRIFSYGHRNVQGLALFDEPKDGIFGYSVEHGSDRDDEVNTLRSGNFGWAPRVTYVERGIPMTDKERFPEAVSALWSSGVPTIAPSGAVILKGEQWGTWNGAVAMAVLKDKHVRILKFDEVGGLVTEKKILTDFGRIRSTALGPDGELYLTTDNGTNDKIIKVTPSGN